MRVDVQVKEAPSRYSAHSTGGPATRVARQAVQSPETNRDFALQRRGRPSDGTAPLARHLDVAGWYLTAAFAAGDPERTHLPPMASCEHVAVEPSAVDSLQEVDHPSPNL